MSVKAGGTRCTQVRVAKVQDMKLKLVLVMLKSRCLLSVILATWETKIGRIVVQGHPG
jgi:hypothetical protein